MPKAVFAVGGTGGHIFPAVQLAKELDGETLFIGNGNAFVDDLPYVTVAAATPFGKNPVKALYQLSRGFIQCRKLLKKERPTAVIGFGSFHSVPTLLAARTLGIPFALFESNAIMGRANRLFAHAAKEIFSPFALDGAKPIQLPTYSKEVTKTMALDYYDLDPGKVTLLVFGGSQGAAPINELILHALPDLPKEVQVIHLVGKNGDVAEVEAAYHALEITAAVKEFEPAMGFAWSAADLALCRAGASTIAEILHFAVPAILIPYPHATDNHQRENALFLEEVVGGGTVMAQHNATGAIVAEQMREIIDTTLPLLREAIVRFTEGNSRPHFSDAVRRFLSTIS
jgi:UDP-N-acetylglucosamine--N-acetylmuramyl-(pentapeptide) pyrophosphoryl-undecaprenol N-acetylglucosamine transferase